MYEFKQNGKVFRGKFVGTGPSPYKKRIYRAAVSQILRNTNVIEKDAAENWKKCTKCYKWCPEKCSSRDD